MYLRNHLLSGPLIGHSFILWRSWSIHHHHRRRRRRHRHHHNNHRRRHHRHHDRNRHHHDRRQRNCHHHLHHNHNHNCELVIASLYEYNVIKFMTSYQVDGWRMEWMSKELDEWMEPDRWMDGWMYGRNRMGGQVIEWRNEWTSRWMTEAHPIIPIQWGVRMKVIRRVEEGSRMTAPKWRHQS